MCTKSIECPQCTNNLWDIHFNNDKTSTARCANCHYERPYFRRTPGRHMTTSQRDAVERIRHHFSTHNDGKFHRFDVEISDSGKVIVSLYTTGEWYSDEHLLAFIGRRGGISIHMYRHGSSAKEFNMDMVKIVARSIGATVRKGAV